MQNKSGSFLTRIVILKGTNWRTRLVNSGAEEPATPAFSNLEDRRRSLQFPGSFLSRVSGLFGGEPLGPIGLSRVSPIKENAAFSAALRVAAGKAEIIGMVNDGRGNPSMGGVPERVQLCARCGQFADGRLAGRAPDPICGGIIGQRFGKLLGAGERTGVREEAGVGVG